MLLNSIFNKQAQKMLWSELVHMYKRVRNISATTRSHKISFGIFYGEKTKIIGSFLEFGRIGYITKRDKFMKKMIDKTFKASMVVYPENHTR